MISSSYRPDIDGLRAVAVLIVVLFHVGFEQFSGGFIGVDVFFVISGFLITRLIRNEVKAGKFKFRVFYLRRIRRLFPALFFTLALSFLCAFLMFSAEHFERFSGAVVTSIFSVSNFYFWLESGYFDTEASFKPLLHTWSLSVEEQFYLIWPATLFLLLTKLPKRAPQIAIVILGIISLYFAENWLYTDPEGAFFLTPFRIIEFAFGGILVWTDKYQPRNKMMLEPLLFLGLALVFLSSVNFSEETPFPGLYSLLPCTGAALVIYAGRANYFGRLLNNPAAVGIGLISYSLYLVHWPIIVFYKYYTLDELSIIEKTCIVVLSIFLAVFSYYYIETPFRRPKENKQQPSLAFLSSCAFLALLLAIPAATAWLNNGWAWRILKQSPPQELVYTHERRGKAQWQDSVSEKIDRALVLGAGSQSPDAQRALILGDSHAGRLRSLANYLGDKYNIRFEFFAYPGCPPIFGSYKVYNYNLFKKKGPSPTQEGCKQIISLWEQHVRDMQYDYVLLVSRWMWLYEPVSYGTLTIRRDFLVDRQKPEYSTEASRRVFRDKLKYTIKVIRDSGSTPIIFSQVPNHGNVLEGCDDVPQYIFDSAGRGERCVAIDKPTAMKRLNFTNAVIKELSQPDDVYSVIPSDYFCRDGEQQCRLFIGTGRLYADEDHINSLGAVYLAKEWEKEENFPFKR